MARCNCPLTESEQQFQFVNNWTKFKGNHQIKFGGDIRYAMNLRIPSDNNRTGEYNFSPQATSNGGGWRAWISQRSCWDRSRPSHATSTILIFPGATTQQNARSAGSFTARTHGA